MAAVFQPDNLAGAVLGAVEEVAPPAGVAVGVTAPEVGGDVLLVLAAPSL